MDDPIGRRFPRKNPSHCAHWVVENGWRENSLLQQERRVGLADSNGDSILKTPSRLPVTPVPGLDLYNNIDSDDYDRDCQYFDYHITWMV